MDFKSMSRKELQALCKEHRLPANTTNSIMAESLASLLQGSDKIKPKPKGCLKGSGGRSDDDVGGGMRPTKKVTFTLQEEALRFGGSKAIRSPEKRRSSRRRSVIGSELMDLSNGVEEMRSTSTRARSAAGSVSYSAVVEVEQDRVSVGDSHLGRTLVRKRSNSKDEGEKLEKNERTRKRSRGVGISNPREEEPPLRRSRRKILRSGEGIESTDKLGQTASETSNGEEENSSSAREEDESLPVGRRKLQRKRKKTDTEAEEDTETRPSKHEAPTRRSTRKVIVSNVLEKGSTSLAGEKRESKRSGASSENEVSLPDVETKEETKKVVETNNEGPRRSGRNAANHTVSGVEITLPVTEKGTNGGIINGRKNLTTRHASEVDVSTIVTESLVDKKANKASELQKQQSDEVVEKPFVEAHIANCETFGEAEALEDHRLNEEPKRRSRRNISKNKLCAPAVEITEKKREVKRAKAALSEEVIPVLESEAAEAVDEAAAPQDDLSLNQENENSCQESIRNAVTNDASDHKLAEETPKILDMNDEEGLVVVISGKKQSSQNPNKEAENFKYGDTVFLEESSTAEKLDGSINKQDNTEEMEYNDGKIYIPGCLDASDEIIEAALDDNVCLNAESVLDHDGATVVDSEIVSHVDMKDSASSVDRKELEEQINNQSAVQFVDAESGGSIFMADGSCNSVVAVNSQYPVIGHSEGFSSQTAPETSPMVDWKTTATSIGHDAVEAANGCLPTDTENIEASEQSSFENSLIETKSFSGPIQQSCSLASCESTELSRGISADKLGAKFEETFPVNHLYLAAETQKKLDKTLEKLLLVLSTLKDGNSVTGATIYTNSSQFLGSPDCLKIRDVVDEADSRSHLSEKGCGSNIEETSKQTRNTPNYIVQTSEQDFVDYEENAESCIISKNVSEQIDTVTVSEEGNEDDEVDDNHVTPGASIDTVHAKEGKQSSLSGSTNLMSSSSHFQVIEKPESPGNNNNNDGGTAVYNKGSCNRHIEETVNKVVETMNNNAEEYSSTARHSLIGFKDLSAEIQENSLVDHDFALESIDWESGKKDYHVNSGCEKSIASQPTADLRRTDEVDVGNNEEISEDRMKLVEKNAGCKSHNQNSDNDGKHGKIDEVSFDSMSPEFISETNWFAPGAHLPSLETLFCVEREEVPAIMADCSQIATQEHSIENDGCEFSGETANNDELSHKAVAPMEDKRMTTAPFLSDNTVENEVEVQKNLVDLASDCLEMIDGNESDKPLETGNFPRISTPRISTPNVDELEGQAADDPPARIGIDTSADGDKSQEEEGTNFGYGNSVDLKTSDIGEVSVTKKPCTEVVEPFATVSCYEENTNQDFVEKPEEAIDKPAPQSAITEMNITEEITVSKELDSKEQLQPQSSDIVDQSVGRVGDQCILNNSEAENVEATEPSHETRFVENTSADVLIQQDCGSDSRQVMEVSSSISADNHVSKPEDSSQCQGRMEEISHQLPSVSIFSAKKFGNTSCNAAITADKNKENTPAIKINHSNKRNVDKSTTKSSLRRPLQIIHSSKAEKQL